MRILSTRLRFLAISRRALSECAVTLLHPRITFEQIDDAALRLLRAVRHYRNRYVGTDRQPDLFQVERQGEPLTFVTISCILSEILLTSGDVALIGSGNS